MLAQIEDECKYREYSASSAQDAATVVAERCMIAVRDLTGQDFKLVIAANVLQKCGAGLHTVSSCYW